MSVPTKGSVTQPQTCSDCHLTLGMHGIPPKIILCPKHAAVDDLLAALAALLLAHRSLVNSDDCGFWEVENEEAVIAARAAIARAGGQP